MTVSAVPKAGDLRRRLRTDQPRRSPKETLSLLFERALYLGVLGGLTFEAVRDHAGRVEHVGTPVVQVTAAVVALLCLVLLAKTMLAFGPLYAGGPSRTWLLSTPVDRGSLLAGKLAAAVAVGAGASAALGLAFVLVSGAAVALVPWLVLWAALGVIVTCACVLAQARRVPVRRALDVLAYALAGAALAVPFLRPGSPPPFLERIDATVCAAALLGAAIALFAARRALDAMTRATISSGVELATAAQVSVLSLDSTFLWAIALERRARAMVRVRPAPIRGNRFTALVRADVARVLRMRSGLFVWAALLPVPYAAHVAGMTTLLPVLHLVAAFLAVDRLAGGLRIISRAPALRRALGGSDRLLTLAHLVVPAVGSVVWCAVSAAFVPGITVAAAALSAVGAVLVTYRMATKPPVDYGGALIDLGLFGPAPVALIMQLLRGPALLAVLALAQAALASS
ncbi:DUF6297 family protein [Spirillospora sp. NPDC050679]